ncbi:tubulin gamma complex-associated protein [Corchorus olitorius]|uniref:Tubulin gamma complex-associated protein n=1 Tax=Corchorus olitorius TaxID=93759 RepID=A0A1R3HMS5_9ROSI|nr:tubulin gamma complex-associated protein [Corchorus olitorius]
MVKLRGADKMLKNKPSTAELKNSTGNFEKKPNSTYFWFVSGE